MTEQVFGDMSEEFEFENETGDYLDGPVLGWVRRRRDGARFAYDCKTIIIDTLWHWVLVPAPTQSTDAALVISEARSVVQGAWLSVVEDRRTSSTSVCRLVSMTCRLPARPSNA